MATVESTTQAAKPSVATKPDAVASAAKPVTKATAKATAPAKTATKPVVKAKPAAKKTAAKPAAKPTTKPVAKAVKAVTKSAAKSASKPVAKPAAPKVAKEKKIKMVRDSFTMPKPEFAVLDVLKIRAAKMGYPVKKTELLRAGIKTLAALSDASFLTAVRAVPNLKTGRPSKAK